MSIRVTQHTMYNNMVGHMQSNLGAYMESIQQGSSQKKINRPSDDPAGTYRVLTTRNDMVGTEQYQENVDTAKGWLNLADSVLSTNVATALTGLKALAEQASTGTYTADQRMIMADQARQYFGQLLNLSNTQYEDMHIFGGHKYDQPAFQQGLAATSWDENWDAAIDDGQVKVVGSSERTVIVQFTEPADLDEPNSLPKFRWSNDGGETWQDGKIEQNFGQDEDGNTITTGYTFDMPGSGVTMTIDGDELPPVVAADTSAGPGANNGTLLYIRPTAYYMGDDKD
ncbi:MAG: flagellar hook protein, partial [Desulfovibrio sp.]|nr:flagellar hook protein [Desulfovibrio sp.]